MTLPILIESKYESTFISAEYVVSLSLKDVTVLPSEPLLLAMSLLP